MLSVDSVCENSFPISLFRFQFATKVVAMAVSMVITTLRILPQRVLLLKVPILFRVQIKELFAKAHQAKAVRVQSTEYR